MKFDVAELYENLSKHFNRAPLMTTLHEDLHAFCVYLESNSLNFYRSVSEKDLDETETHFMPDVFFPVFMTV